MYLKSIELSGFKSFAKRSILEFTSPISAIVGPNGSGKSNIAEAFRFVLGEQSIKNMRGKRGDDLIFNGSTGSPQAGRAVVKLIFDNTKKIFNPDFSEVTIERVVHRDGVNEYSLNGSRVRLKDVLELLAGAKIGSSGHHIISQGEADKILSANFKERKVFVEDALGLRLYQYKRLESERKLDKTFENIAQVESLKREIAPHLRFLTRQVEKIEKAQELQSGLLSLAKEYFKREEVYISAEWAAIAEERSPLKLQRERLEKELASAKKVLKAVGEKEKKDYAVLALEGEISAVRARKNALGRELGRVEGLMSAEERIVRKQKELAASNALKSITLRKLEDFARSIEDEAEARAIKLRLREFIERSKESSERVVLAESEKALEDFSDEKKKLEANLASASTEEKCLEDKYEALKQEIERQKDSGRDAEKAVFRIMSEEKDLLSKQKLLDVRAEKLAIEDAEFRRELEEVAHLVGAEVLQYKSMEMPHPRVEERTRQEERKREIQKAKIRLEDAGFAGSLEVMKEFKETSERNEFLAKELLDLEKSAESLRELIKDLEERLAKEFAEGLDKINKSFGELFETMFGGGTAKLVLVKEAKLAPTLEEVGAPTEPEEARVGEEGLEISVNLPRKKIRSLMMLSGGERALTSIALVFAMSLVNPPPFIILDETDAALDESNSKKYGDLVETLSKHSQLILITHNRETMSRAGVIYGVTMSGAGISRLLSIDFTEAVAVAR